MKKMRYWMPFDRLTAMSGVEWLDTGCWIKGVRGRRAVGGNRPYRSRSEQRGVFASRSESGSVLVIVMVVCLGLVSLALMFGYSTALGYRGSVSDLAGRQSQRAIDGAAQYVQDLLLNSGSNNLSNSSASTSSGTSSSSGSNPPTNFLPDPSTYQSEAVQVGDATFWFIGEPGMANSSSSASGLSAGPGSSSSSSSATNLSSNSTPVYGLVDEASKLNLNTANVTMLENLPNMTPSLAQAIVTWRQSGTAASSGTTSSSTSSSSSSSSGVNKGGPFESIYELAQVVQADGDDPSILYGNDTNLNHVMDASESQGSGQFTPGLYEYVTVFSRQPNTVLSTGSSRINIVTGSAAVSAGSSSTTGGSSGGNGGGGSTSSTLRSLLTSTFGQARAGELERNYARAARGTPPNSVLAYYVRSGMTAAELDQIGPYLTNNTGNYKSGLINVNTASATVLECVPGITPAMATQIVSTRQSNATPSTNLAWVAPILGNTAAIQAGPYLTTESYQVTADVAAVGPNGLGYRRTLFVIDASNGTPQIVYRHDMTPLGWALGPNATQSLAQQQTLKTP